MKVKELIGELLKTNQEARVVITDNGFDGTAVYSVLQGLKCFDDKNIAIIPPEDAEFIASEIPVSDAVILLTDKCLEVAFDDDPEEEEV